MSNKGLTKVMAVALALIAPVIAFKPTRGAADDGFVAQPLTVAEWLDALPLPQRIKEDAMEGMHAMPHVPPCDTHGTHLFLSPIAVVNNPIKYIGAGLASGFVSGLLGVGGGVLMSSFLSSTTDIPQATVVATSLLSVVPVGLAGTYHNYRYGNVQFRAAGLIGASATYLSQQSLLALSSLHHHWTVYTLFVHPLPQAHSKLCNHLLAAFTRALSRLTPAITCSGRGHGRDPCYFNSCQGRSIHRRHPPQNLCSRVARVKLQHVEESVRHTFINQSFSFVSDQSEEY